jgi:hypothetical protein
MGAIWTMRHRLVLERMGNIASRTDAAVQQPVRDQPVTRRLISCNVLRLKLHSAVMMKPKPVHIRQYRRDMLRTATCSVNIFNPQVELTTQSPRKIMCA